jgi:hypothetical protein
MIKRLKSSYDCESMRKEGKENARAESDMEVLSRAAYSRIAGSCQIEYAPMTLTSGKAHVEKGHVQIGLLRGSLA